MQFNARIDKQGKLEKTREETREMTIILVRLIFSDCRTLSLGRVVRKQPTAPSDLIQRFGSVNGLVRMLRAKRVERWLRTKRIGAYKRLIVNQPARASVRLFKGNRGLAPSG